MGIYGGRWENGGWEMGEWGVGVGRKGGGRWEKIPPPLSAPSIGAEKTFINSLRL